MTGPSENALLRTEEMRDLSPILWIGMPVLTVAVRMLAPLLGYDAWFQQMRAEIGFIEISTVVFCVPVMVLSVVIFRRRGELPRGMGWIVLGVGLVALYFAGEECSWGQTYLGYETPDAVAAANKQDEFNLHNLLGWQRTVFNILPRFLMTVVMIVGGIILPFIAYPFLHKPGLKKNFWYWMIPTYRVVPIAAMGMLSRVPHKLVKYVAPDLPADNYWSMSLVGATGELKEYCMSLAMLFFVISIYVRMGPKKTAT
jgi:hypothetical protein